MYCGVELDVSIGVAGGNGTVQNVQYFTCPQGHGCFSARKKVSLVAEPVDEEGEEDEGRVAGEVVLGAVVATEAQCDQWEAVYDEGTGDVYYVSLVNVDADSQWERPSTGSVKECPESLAIYGAKDNIPAVRPASSPSHKGPCRPQHSGFLINAFKKPCFRYSLL
jgi:hypothetical protein